MMIVSLQSNSFHFSILCLASWHMILCCIDSSHIQKPTFSVSLPFTKKVMRICFLWWNLMPNYQGLMAESDTQTFIRANRDPHPNNLHLLKTEKEMRKRTKRSKDTPFGRWDNAAMHEMIHQCIERKETKKENLHKSFVMLIINW